MLRVPAIAWQGLLLLVIVLLLLNACAAPLTTVAARQTAVVAGCWPYGAEQPLPSPTEPTATPPLFADAGTVTPSPTVDAAATPTAPPAGATVYPACTPAPDVPTSTMTVSRTPSPIPPQTEQPPGGVLHGASEIGQQPGYASARTLAINPTRGTAVVGWISWAANWIDDSHDGRVWVRVEASPGVWNPLQSVNTSPVKKFFGGLGIAVTRDNVVHVVYGGGGVNGDNTLYLVESTDDGMTWSDPVPLGISGAAPPDATPSPTETPTATPTLTPTATPTTTVDLQDTATPLPSPTTVDTDGAFTPEADANGGALALRADDAGGLHLLYLTAEGGYHLGYAQRAPGARTWQRVDRLEGGEQYGGQLAVLSYPDGRVRRFVLLKDGSNGAHITLYRSDDGQKWQPHRMQTDRFLENEKVIATSVLAIPRAGGLVAVAWSQYAAGGVFAQVSLDGGDTWSSEEQIAQHEQNGALFGQSGKGLHAGFEPSLAYDRASDRLVASYIELDLGPRPIVGRVLLAARPLTPDTSTATTPWQYAITPDSPPDNAPPQLSIWGLRGFLVGTSDGRFHWLLTVDERNQQNRVSARAVNLAALLDLGVS